MALKGIKVIEMPGQAPGPFCGTMLADFGADVTVVQKIQQSHFHFIDISQGKKTIAIDLKRQQGISIVKRLCNKADVLIDSYRPGVLENMGLGPGVLLKDNPRLIYARVTGYGQEGFMKDKAGHDINFVAMSGVLSVLRYEEKPPVPPIMLISDFAGGSALCAFGIMLALHERTKTGKGQIVDASMTQGLAYLASYMYRMLKSWGQAKPGTHVLGGAAPFYKVYRTKDDKFMAVGTVEAKCYKELLKGLQLSDEEYGQGDTETLEKLQEIFLEKTQDEWSEIFDKLDACVTPVLELDSIDKKRYYSDSKTFYRDANDVIVPQPSPKLSTTPGVSVGRKPSPQFGEHTVDILKESGYSLIEIEQFVKDNLVSVYKKSSL